MKIAIFGCGALGSNLAYILVGAHPDWGYYLFDYDKVETRNIPNQWFRPSQIGLYKSEALQLNLYDQYGIITQAQKLKIDTKPALDQFDLCLDCFDNAESRALISCPHAIHIAYSAERTFEVVWDKEFKPEKAQDGFDICTWRGAKAFICLVASLGAIAVNQWVLNNIRINFLGNERTIKSWICNE